MIPTIFGISLSGAVHTGVVLAGLLVYGLTTHLLGQRRNPSAAIGWVLSILLLPYVALPIFLLFGTRKFARGVRQPGHGTVQPDGDWVTATLRSMGMPPPTANEFVNFHQDGHSALAALTRLIEESRASIDVSAYLIGNDAVGDTIVGQLARRAREGIRVRLLLDFIGCLFMARRHVRELRRAGVDLRWFMPLMHNPMRGRTNLRNHRKLCIGDGRELWSGGRNLAAEYFIGSKGEVPWTDLSFSVAGPLARQAVALFDADWRAASGRDPLAPHAEAADSGAPLGNHIGQLVPSGPDQPDDTVYSLLLTAFFRAQRRLAVVTPYFVPDDGLLFAMCLAARRGVSVELLVPAHSNHRLADVARHRALRELAQSGGTVRLAPTMVHAKAIVVDDMWALCGSVNLDGRSLFLNYEMMVAFYSAEDVRAVNAWIAEAARTSSPYAARRASLLRDIGEGLILWLGFQL